MLEIKATEKISKAEYKERMKPLQEHLGVLQQNVKAAKLPVIVLFEGWGSSGKGTLLNKLIGCFDPRGFKFYDIDPPEKNELTSSISYFASVAPKEGIISILERSWYRLLLDGNADSEAGRKGIRAFERQLTNSGVLVVKFFLNISKVEQRRRFDELKSDSETAWRVTPRDEAQNKNYDELKFHYDDILSSTNYDFSRWHVIDAKYKRNAALEICGILSEELKKALARPAFPNDGEIYTADAVLMPVQPISYHPEVVPMSREDYDKRLKKLKKEIGELQLKLFKARIPAVIAFEGWDAAGKGGAIKRLTSALDPRAYEVCPIASPTPEEKAHHYLWRFARALPEKGHITIFDRSWYGRVMVERIEGFCSPRDWKRAYGEINEFEFDLVRWGAIVLKFFINISPEVQLERFNERAATPSKQWKLTDEDWRNRDKWSAYETAIDDMMRYTNTEYAPWTIIEGKDKYSARIAVLEEFIRAAKASLSQREHH